MYLYSKPDNGERKSDFPQVLWPPGPEAVTDRIIPLPDAGPFNKNQASDRIHMCPRMSHVNFQTILKKM